MNILKNKTGAVFVKSYDATGKGGEQTFVGETSDGFDKLKENISEVLKEKGSNWKSKYRKKLLKALNR